jgi:hypothetical protein
MNHRSGIQTRNQRNDADVKLVADACNNGAYAASCEFAS